MILMKFSHWNQTRLQNTAIEEQGKESQQGKAQKMQKSL